MSGFGQPIYTCDGMVWYMKKFLYSKKMELMMRILAGIAIVLLLSIDVLKFFGFLNSNEGKIDFETLKLIIANFFVAVLFAFVLIYPHKFGLIAIACFYYAVPITEKTINPMNILMFSLALLILNVRGFFLKHIKVKIILLSLALFAMQCTRLRFGINFFVDGFINDIGYSLVFLSGIFFTYVFAVRNVEPTKKILNVAEYEGLKEADADMLRRVLDNQQYKMIAIDFNQKEGSIRNRLNKIYDTLGCADRIGFLTMYTGFQIVYEPIITTSVTSEESIALETEESLQSQSI